MKRAYATPTARLLTRFLREPNPVTRSVLADIIGDRIDRYEAEKPRKKSESNDDKG